jgi:transcription elongation GreA/GreB family factor
MDSSSLWWLNQVTHSRVEGISVQVGDHVTYVDTAQPDKKLQIQIVSGQDRLDAGIINEARPLAQALLEAEEGDEVELSIPGRPSHNFKVLKIDRASSATPTVS